MTQYQTLLLPDDTVQHGAFNTLEWFASILHEVYFKGKEVIDYGCAEGVMSLLAKKAGARSVLGIDKDRERIDQAVSLMNQHHTPINFYCGNLYEQEVNADIGIFSLIIHWLTDPQKDLRKILARIDETAIIVFREKNDGYQKENGNWFPTLDELDTYMASCSFKCQSTKLLQTQDNNKNIYLKIFKRTKNLFYTTDGRYVVKVGQFRPGWKQDFETLKNDLELPAPYHGSSFYIQRRFNGTRLSDLQEYFSNYLDKEELAKLVRKLREAFESTNLMFTDLSPGNIMYVPGNGFHVIDFDDIGAWDENNERWRELCQIVS